MTIEMMIALGAVLVSIFGAWFNYYQLKDEQKTWEQEQKISMEKVILFKTLKKRRKLYKNIFKLLGEVRDIDYPKEHYIEIESDKQKLIKVADAILNELYGEAGLFMSYETRSAILKAYQMSYRYANGEVNLNDLIDSYYYSRRMIRQDLEFDDVSSSKTAKKILETTKEIVDDKDTLNWAVKDGSIARSPRPGYPNKVVSQETLNETINIWKAQGIKSIICLLSDEEINEYYEVIQYDLIGFYKKHGFEVYHTSIVDFQKPPIEQEQLNSLYNNYMKTAKPVLIHCGAGEDRTGCLVGHILNKQWEIYK
jgi:protein-tyrosine phosphatase